MEFPPPILHSRSEIKERFLASPGTTVKASAAQI
jgi:hypothetical protein